MTLWASLVAPLPLALPRYSRPGPSDAPTGAAGGAS